MRRHLTSECWPLSHRASAIAPFHQQRLCSEKLASPVKLEGSRRRACGFVKPRKWASATASCLRQISIHQRHPPTAPANSLVSEPLVRLWTHFCPSPTHSAPNTEPPPRAIRQHPHRAPSPPAPRTSVPAPIARTAHPALHTPHQFGV